MNDEDKNDKGSGEIEEMQEQEDSFLRVDYKRKNKAEDDLEQQFQGVLHVPEHI